MMSKYAKAFGFVLIGHVIVSYLLLPIPLSINPSSLLDIYDTEDNIVGSEMQVRQGR